MKISRWTRLFALPVGLSCAIVSPALRTAVSAENVGPQLGAAPQATTAKTETGEQESSEPRRMTIEFDPATGKAFTNVLDKAASEKAKSSKSSPAEPAKSSSGVATISDNDAVEKPVPIAKPATAPKTSTTIKSNVPASSAAAKSVPA